MAWAGAGSHVFRIFLADVMLNVAAFDLDSDTFKVALYNDSITPDNDVATATLSTYNGAGSQWLVANEVTHAQWPAAGQTLASPVINVGTADVVFWDGTDTASGANATLANVYGCLVHDTTISSRGVCYNYFGGTNSVTNGTLTVVWHANGIWRATL